MALLYRGSHRGMAYHVLFPHSDCREYLPLEHLRRKMRSTKRTVIRRKLPPQKKQEGEPRCASDMAKTLQVRAPFIILPQSGAGVSVRHGSRKSVSDITNRRTSSSVDALELGGGITTKPVAMFAADGAGAARGRAERGSSLRRRAPV